MEDGMAAPPAAAPQIELTPPAIDTPPPPAAALVTAAPVASVDDLLKIPQNTSKGSKIQGSSSADNISTGHVPLKRSSSSSRVDNKKRICTSCGTSTTPMWRRGPEGPLCNACGVKYRVQLKRSNKKLRPDGGDRGGGGGRRGGAATQADSDDDHTPESEDAVAEPAPAPASHRGASAAEAEIVGRVARLVTDLDELRETTRQIDAKMEAAFAVIKQLAQHTSTPLSFPPSSALTPQLGTTSTTAAASSSSVVAIPSDGNSQGAHQSSLPQ